MVRTTRPGPAQDDYVEVEWGPDLALHHAMGQAGRPDPSLVVDLGPLGLSYILEAGGQGYFRLGAVRPHLDAGRLALVPDAPEFLYPAYAVFSESGGDIALLETAIAGLRDVAGAERRRAAGPA
jgi:hypothetical protein